MTFMLEAFFFQTVLFLIMLPRIYSVIKACPSTKHAENTLMDL